MELAERMRAGFERAVAPLGVPVPLARALMVMSAPVAMRDMAARLHCDPSYVTGLADQLEDRGWARREEGADRRVKLLALTPEGTRMRRMVADAVPTDPVVFDRLDAPERSLVASLLHRQLTGGPSAEADAIAAGGA